MRINLPEAPPRWNADEERWFRSEVEGAFARIADTSDIPARTTRVFRTVTSSGSVGRGDDVVLVDASGGAVTLTLPSASDYTKELCVKKIDVSGNTVTIDGASSETIDDKTTLTLAYQYDAVRIASDGSEWWIL